MTPYERRALSRELSALANASVAEALMHDETRTEACAIIGITGPPGVGKSTLIGNLARLRLETSLAIVAIDPSSPVSGGALLGDRIRMLDLSDDPRIYIRSLATRASRDGLADNLPMIINRLARAGFDEILIETTGVGQVEYTVRSIVDTMVLVLSPGAGDQVQAMKSGILETPDIFVVNKADQPGAENVANETRTIIRYRDKNPLDWLPPVILTRPGDAAALEELSAAINAHRRLRQSQTDPAARARAWQTQVIGGLLARHADEVLKHLAAGDFVLPLAELYNKVVAAIAAGSLPQRSSGES